MDLGLAGRVVESALIEYTVRLQLSGGYFIVIASPLRLESAVESIVLSPEDDPEESLQPLRLLPVQVIDDAVVDSAGALHIHLGDSTRIIVEPDGLYEAWNVSGPAGFLVVCLPSGTLAHWSAASSGDTNGH